MRIHLKNPIIIFLCFIFALFFIIGSFLLVNAAGDVQFTADTIVSLSGVSDGSLSIASSSDATSINVSGAVLTVNGVPNGDDFTLKTPTSTIALQIIPSNGTTTLSFDSSNLSTGYIAQWMLTATGSVQVAHIVGVSSANTWYAIKTDGTLVNSYQSSAGGEISFTYDGSWSSKVFTIEEDTTAPTSFSLTSPVNDSSTTNTQPTFSWNASSDSDVSHYQLYIDGSLDTNNISGTSTTSANALSCGDHAWYVRVVDNAGNGTNSSAFNLTINCGGGGLPIAAYLVPIPPAPSASNPLGEFKVLINDDTAVTNNRIITLKFFAGDNTKRMAISESPDFKNAIQEAYSEAKEWNLSEGEGKKTIYVKFFTEFGIPSEIISDEIVLGSVSITPTPSVFPTADFTKNLDLGSQNADVKTLQQYLNVNDFKVAESGPGSPGNETKYFGLLTKAALIKFQEAYADKILTPVGLTNGTGYFGPSTRAFINYGSLTPIVEEKELSVIFTRGLDIGMRGDDIRQLQQLLNTDPDTRLSDSGVGSLGNETNYFGPLTQKAVQKFQM